MKKLYAAISPSGQFHFNSIAARLRDVKILPSDAKYGGIRAGVIFLTPLVAQAAPVSDSSSDWNAQHTAWVWRNPDESLWMDTLSLTKAETTGWASNPARLESLGFEVIAVLLQTEAALEAEEACA